MSDVLENFPVDIHNEQVILGQALKFPEMCDMFLSHVTWENFLEKKHRAMAWCIITMVQRQMALDNDSFILVINEFPISEYKSYGGNTYLEKVKSLCLTPNQNYVAHLTKLKNDYIKSTIARDATIRLMQKINDPHASISEIVASVDIIKSSVEENRPVEIDFYYGERLHTHYMNVLRERVTKSKFVTTGFDDLDEDLSEAFAPCNVSVIAGYTGMSKSAFVQNAMIRQAGAGFRTGIASLEMVLSSVLDRQVSIMTQIPSNSIIKRTADLTHEEKLLIAQVMNGIKESEMIFINDKATLNLEQIDTQLTLLNRIGKPLNILYIDLFGKLDDVSVESNLASNIEHKLRLTRAMARKHNIHICCVVQIRRYFDLNTIRPNKPIPKPKLDKIKNSNAFAEEADLVLLLHRDKYYKPELTNDIIEIEIAKQRQGSMGIVKYFEFESECTRIKPTSLRPVIFA